MRLKAAAKKPEINKRSSISRIKANQSRSLGSPVNDVLFLQRTAGNQAVQRLIQGARNNRNDASNVDFLSKQEEEPEVPFVDQAGPTKAPTTAPAAPVAPAPARPTNLYQILNTGWAPGPNRYGFQLQFTCRSTSGNVIDLQNQAPNLIWREHVAYPHNDFSHQINPPNPTIRPPGGGSFAPAHTTVIGPNLLRFNTITDTHWFPTWAVNPADFAPGRPGAHPLPAVIESRQVYQYSLNGGGNWRYFAGSFIIRRILFHDGAGNLRFLTRKTGVHGVTEAYKP